MRNEAFGKRRLFSPVLTEAQETCTASCLQGGPALLSAGAKIFYNTLVALPMSLSLMKDRLEQRYYRQVEGWLGDVATIQGNARAFNGDDSPVTEAAAGTCCRHRFWHAQS